METIFLISFHLEVQLQVSWYHACWKMEQILFQKKKAILENRRHGKRP